MAVEMKGRVGPVTLADGSEREVSLDRTGAQRASLAHGKWFEAASRGAVFTGTSAAAGVAPGATLGTTMAYALYNPVGSDVDLVVMAVGIGYVSGTLAAGTLVAASYVENAANAAPTGTAVVEQCTRLGVNKSKGKPLETVTLSAAPLIMFPLFDLTAKLATTALHNAPFFEPVNGVIVIPPGTTLAIGGITAAEAGSPLIVIGTMWEEIPRVG